MKQASSNSNSGLQLNLQGQYQRIAALFSITTLILVTVTVWFSFKNSRQEVYERAEEYGNFLFATTAHLFSDPLYLNDIEQVRKNSEFLSSQNYILRLTIFNELGQYVFDSNQQNMPSGEISPQLLSLAISTRGPSNRWRDHSLEFIGAIEFDGQVIGGINFILDVSSQLATVDENLKNQFLLGMFFVVLATGLSFAIAGNLAANRSLRHVESNFRLLIEQSPVANAIFSTSGLLTYSNPAYKQLMSKNEQTLQATKPGYNLLEDPLLTDSEVLPQIANGFISGAIEIPRFCYGKLEEDLNASQNILLGNDKASGLWLKAVISPLHEEDGSILEVVVVFLDESAEQSAEDEREELSTQVLQSQKLEGLGILAGGIAHDFNNLLVPIFGNAELLALKLQPDSDLHANVKSIFLSAERAAELCSQMLDYAGQGTVEKVPLNLSTEITGLKDFFSVSMGKAARLEQHLTTPLPPITANQAQVRQIILNLLINASDSLEGKSGQVSIETGVTKLSDRNIRQLFFSEGMEAGDCVFLKVTDTGCGMTEEVRQNLFNPFFTTKTTGRGLGMSAVVGIIARHHGGIEVISEVGVGSTFTIFFPMAVETDA